MNSSKLTSPSPEIPKKDNGKKWARARCRTGKYIPKPEPIPWYQLAQNYNKMQVCFELLERPMYGNFSIHCDIWLIYWYNFAECSIHVGFDLDHIWKDLICLLVIKANMHSDYIKRNYSRSRSASSTISWISLSVNASPNSLAMRWMSAIEIFPYIQTK